MTLYAPDGSVLEARKEEHWPPEFMKMLTVFAMGCAETELGIVCNRCHQGLQGQNATSDNFFKMECACRTYIGRNPLDSAGRRAN